MPNRASPPSAFVAPSRPRTHPPKKAPRTTPGGWYRHAVLAAAMAGKEVAGTQGRAYGLDRTDAMRSRKHCEILMMHA